MLEELIPILDLGFQNPNPNIHFWLNLGRKKENCTFCLKIGTLGILEEFIPNPELDFQKSNLKIHFLTNLGKKAVRVILT